MLRPAPMTYFNGGSRLNERKFQVADELSLAKVVAGVVVRTGVKVPRWAHSRGSDRSRWKWVCRHGAFAGSATRHGRVFSTMWWGNRGSSWVRKSGSVSKPACVSR